MVCATDLLETIFLACPDCYQSFFALLEELFDGFVKELSVGIFMCLDVGCGDCFVLLESIYLRWILLLR